MKLLDRLPESNQLLHAELGLRGIESMVAFVQGPGSPQRERAIRRMCELGEKLEERDQLLRGLINLGGIYAPRGELVQAQELVTRCLRLAQEVQDGGLLADSSYFAGVLGLFRGNLAEAASLLEDAALDSGRTKRRLSNLGLLYASSIPCMRASVLQHLGQTEQAARFLEEGLRQARESRHLFSLAQALATAALVAQHRREPEVARACAEEVIALSEENGFALWLFVGRVNRGWAMTELGQIRQGIAEMESANMGSTHIAYGQHERIAGLANAYARIGRAQEGFDMLEDALGQIERIGEKRYQAEMLRLKAHILLTCNRAEIEPAESCFSAALDVARAQGAKWWELRSSVSLARLLRDTSRRDEGRTLLAEIYNWFTEGFDTADLKDAKALLDELSV